MLGGSKYFRKDKSPQLHPTTTTPVSSNGRLASDYESDDEYC
jgi:hypothetical protein